ncbi:MAG: aminotransferase class V-fold PLP-dependent enzyme [Ignavibacteriales bacterium]|nr:aminotransferase class V-fold PLP-dependent enzyme [Ignavibacteriales bacterium]
MPGSTRRSPSSTRSTSSDEAPDGVYWEEVRQALRLRGPLHHDEQRHPGPHAQGRLQHAHARSSASRCSNPYDGYNFLPTIRESVRPKLAAFVGASPDEVALTSNTTEGLNLVVNGLDLKRRATRS